MFSCFVFFGSFFFFKQKTAYEMRISDWSSDVCSSDLTVDGKLARCTITSSALGNAWDHGVDLVHPPIWWWAWAVGCAAYGRPLSDTMFWAVIGTMLFGYVAQRLIEGAFIVRFGMHIHVWRRFDSRFRLVTARLNPNMVILFALLLIGRPDWGIIAVAGWTLISLVVHLEIGRAHV